MREDDRLGDEHPEWKKAPEEGIFPRHTGPFVWMMIAIIILIGTLLGVMFEPVRNFYLVFFVFCAVCYVEYAGLLGFFALNHHLHKKAPWAY